MDTSHKLHCELGHTVMMPPTEFARYENGHYLYRIHRAPLSEYKINFIHKLKPLPKKYRMNSVLENFTILQVVTNRDTGDLAVYSTQLQSFSQRTQGSAPHLPPGKRMRELESNGWVTNPENGDLGGNLQGQTPKVPREPSTITSSLLIRSKLPDLTVLNPQ
ncbi:transcriptional enhancer factor TEF-3-like [Rattus norvegicus]|uniref:transcriptional enhancer factor TEF-3-like n=1 Tax=Rattus norvegicus TaxID=10116 RepID=UPI002FD83CB9